MVRQITKVVRGILRDFLEPLLKKQNLKIVPLNYDKLLAERDFGQRTRWLSKIPFRTILDVGANVGYTSKTFRERWPSAYIFAFEPLAACFQELSREFVDDRRFKAYHTALGVRNETSLIHKNDFSLSSSLLEMEVLHAASFPYTKSSSPEEVAVRRLDDILEQVVLEGPILMKLDVQGFEGQVIQGGLETIKRVDVVITEMSVAPLYRGQIEFDELYRLLFSLGFRYCGNYDQLHDPSDGRVLQVDGIFIRESLGRP